MDSGLEASRKLGKMVPCQQGSEDVTATSAGQCELQSLSSALFSFKNQNQEHCVHCSVTIKESPPHRTVGGNCPLVYFFVKMRIIF